MPPAWAAARSHRDARRGAAIAIVVLDSLNEQVLERVARGEVDFGVAPQRSTPPEIAQASLLHDRIDLVCPRNHEFARRKHVTWKQVLRFPFVSLTRDFAYTTTVLGMVKSGEGVTALPTAALPLLSSFGLTALPIHEPVVHREVSIFTRRGESLSPAAESLREFLVEFIAKR
jgi:DNA-binding transcriptional LysR family regulator